MNTTRTAKSGITSYPSDTYTNPNDYVAKTNGNGNKIGPSITLKVMAGDKFNLRVSSWYKTNGTTPGTPTNPLNDLLSALINGVSGAATAAHGITPTALQNGAVLTPGATGFLSNQSAGSNSSKPQGFVNWILFDEQFKMVSSSSGFEQVGANEEFKVHVKNDMPIDKNGYLYIYVSNTTPNIDVFFDNLQVTHVRGQILEETHYYPFGLTMQGISSRAAGNMRNREKTFQGQRFDDEFDLNWVQFKWRNHDPQIGRFIEIDPLSEDYEYNSTYAFSENKVTNNIELEGLESATVRLPHDLSNAQKDDFYRGYNQTFTRGARGVGVAAILVAAIVYPPSMQVTGPIIAAEVFGVPSPNAPSSMLSTATSETRATLSTLEKNAADGKEFEKVVVNGLKEEGHTGIVEQITVKANNGVKTRIDVVSKDPKGNIALTEAKASKTAPLTKNQKKAHPVIAESGGVVVGKGKGDFPGGTKIPPTKVNVIRPIGKIE